MTPELLGAPVAVWALGISLLSFLVAIGALGWQVAKHFLDGGRVKVHLYTAIWEPEVMLATNRSGRFVLHDDDSANKVTRGRALEVAQLVVENPGRSAVTIYNPGLSISGHGKRHHSLVPRMFATGEAFGSDTAVADTLVRLEPYARATFLLDYWSVVPSIMKDTEAGYVCLRGFVNVAGRANRPQMSRRSRRWRIDRGTYTAIQGPPSFTPLAVLWREMFVRLPAESEAGNESHASGRTAVTRGMANSVLDEAMSRFAVRPVEDSLKSALEEIAQRYGDEYPMLGFSVYDGYAALDRMEGHLTEWTTGLFHWDHARRAEARKARREVQAGDEPPAADQPAAQLPE